MDDGCSSDLELDITYEPEEHEVLDRNFPSPPSSGFGNKRTQNQLSPPTTKRSRRSVQKRVVSIPISEVEASRVKGGAAEGAPPSDSWAWRKYGQKPIKGSPYPRGYYRCSSSKGCPARKQVERSRADPTMIVVTYSFEHNHSWPMPKNKNQQIVATSGPTGSPQPAEEEAPEPVVTVAEQETESIPPEAEQKFSDLIGEDCGEFKWLTEGCSTSSGSPPGVFDEMLYGSVFFGGGGAADVAADVAEIDGGQGGEEDGLFEGLGELPEWTVVFRRGMTSASWIGTE